MAAGGISGGQLASFVERYEHLQGEVDELANDKALLIKELEGAGFDKKVFRIVIKRRRMGKEQCDEEDTLVALYEQALVELYEQAVMAGKEAGSPARERPPAREEAGATMLPLP